MQVQVLHQRTLAVHGVPGFAFVRLDQHELRARLQVDHQHRRLDLGTRLVAQVQPDCLVAAGASSVRPVCL